MSRLTISESENIIMTARELIAVGCAGVAFDVLNVLTDPAQARAVWLKPRGKRPVNKITVNETQEFDPDDLLA